MLFAIPFVKFAECESRKIRERRDVRGKTREAADYQYAKEKYLDDMRFADSQPKARRQNQQYRGRCNNNRRTKPIQYIGKNADSESLSKTQ